MTDSGALARALEVFAACDQCEQQALHMWRRVERVVKGHRDGTAYRPSGAFDSEERARIDSLVSRTRIAIGRMTQAKEAVDEARRALETDVDEGFRLAVPAVDAYLDVWKEVIASLEELMSLIESVLGLEIRTDA